MALEELQNGRYRRLRVLGSGGMGEVYLMEDTRVSRQVAIKVLRAEVDPYPEGDTSKDAARLFQREARAIAALEHSNILPLYDFGEERLEGATMTYMVMPFCPDGSLVDWIRQGHNSTSLSPQDTAHLIGQAADALQYAHDHRVIHLDVKPPNFLLRRNAKNPGRPTLLLADFGIARSSATTSSSSRTIRGTPTAMAPEQWSSKPVAASDQYSLAVMAYELLTGRPPFVGSMEQLMFQHFSAQPAEPSKLNPRLPVTIDAVILRALAKKPEDRFPSITAFAAALEQAAQAAPASFQDEKTLSSSDALGAAATLFTRANDAPLPSDVISAAPTVSTPQPKPVSTPQLKLQQSSASASEHDLPTVATTNPKVPPLKKELEPSLPRKDAAPRSRIFAIAGLIILLLLAGTGFYFGSQLNSQQANKAALSHAQTATAQAKTSKITPTAHITATPTPPPGLYIAGTYNGTMLNQLTNQQTSITVFITQTNGSGVLSGSVTFKTSSPTVQQLSGKVDMQGNFTFSVQQSGGQQPLVFYGAVQPDTNLHGNFCNSTTNTCSSNTGYFTVGPRVTG